MKNKIILSASIAFLFGCSADVDAPVDADVNTKNNITINNYGDIGLGDLPEEIESADVVEEEKDLPRCNNARNGKYAFIVKDSAMAICKKGEWQILGETLQSEDDIMKCTSKREGLKVFLAEEAVSKICTAGSWETWLEDEIADDDEDRDVDKNKDDDEDDCIGGCDEKSSSSKPRSSSSSKAKSSSSAGIKYSSSQGSSFRSSYGPVSQYGQLQAGTNSSGQGRIYGSCATYSRSGSEVQVKGMSLYWSLNDYGTRFWNSTYITKLVQDWGIQLIRAPMGVDEDWGDGNYFSNMSYYQGKMDDVVQAAIDNDIYVIIDYHSHKAPDNLSGAKEFFSRMAQKWGAYDNVIFEIFNEPACKKNGSGDCSQSTYGGGYMSWSTIRSYADEVVETIRSYSDNLIIVGTPMWDQQPNAAIGSTVNGTNIAYAFHYYAGSHSTSSEGANAVAAMNAGLSVFVSEWGTINANGDGSVASSNTGWQTWLNTYKLSSANWSVSDLNEGASIFTNASTWTLSASGNWVKNNVFGDMPTSYTPCSGGTVSPASSASTPRSSSTGSGSGTTGDALGGAGNFSNCSSLGSCGWSTNIATYSGYNSVYTGAVELEVDDSGDRVLKFWSNGRSGMEPWDLQAKHSIALKNGYSYQIVGSGYTFDDSYGSIAIGVMDSYDYVSYFEMDKSIDGSFSSTVYKHCGTTDSSAEFFINGGNIRGDFYDTYGGVGGGGFSLYNVKVIETPISCW